MSRWRWRNQPLGRGWWGSRSGKLTDGSSKTRALCDPTVSLLVDGCPEGPEQRPEAFAHLCSQLCLLNGQKVNAAGVHPWQRGKQRGPSRQWNVIEP